MPAQSNHTVWTGFLSPTTADVAVGYCMTLDAAGDYYVIATSANRTAASRTTTVAGITLTAGDSTNRAVEIQTVGPCPPEVTGLGAGSAAYVIVNSSGLLERKTSPAASDIVAGKCDADGWAYLNFVARDAVVTAPGGNTKTVQFNNAAVLDGDAYWTRESTGRINLNYHSMTGGPALDFLVTANTITRSFGSWTTDGFAIGDPIIITGSTSNNVSTTVTNVTSTVLTVAAALVTESASAGAVSIVGGGYLSTGLATATLPNVGAWRVATPASLEPTQVLVSMRTTGGVTVPVLGVADGEILIGGTNEDADDASGVTTQRPNNILIWAQNWLQRWDAMQWQNDGNVIFRHMTRGSTSTTNATPATLTITVPPTKASYTLTVKAYWGAGSGTWSFWYGPDASTPYRFHESKTNAGLDCTFNGTTCTVTGLAATSIEWTAITESNVEGTRFCTLDTANSVLHKSGNVTTIPDVNDTLAGVDATQTLTNKTITGATSITSGYFGASSGTLATAGLVRAANATDIVVVRNSTNSNNNALVASSSGDEAFYGCDSAYSKQVVTIRIYANTTTYLGVGSTSQVALTSTQAAIVPTNVSFFNATGSYGSGTNVIFINNRSAAPSGSPTGGGILYAASGAGTWKGSSGTVTTFGPADPHCEKCGRDFAHAWENDSYDESLAVCMPCLLDALAGLGVPVDTFAKRRLHA